MNKEKFLKELEKRLSILNEKERKDIIEEYKSTIEEKIKNGADEESAVKDFGNINDLVKEILDAYKINPEYKESDFQKFVKDGESMIKECADTLAKGVKDMAESFKNTNQEINLSLVFEIMIKVFLTIIFIGLLRIPFIIFTHIGSYFFEVLFSPLDILIKVLWTIFLSIIYLVIVVIVIFRIFKQYFIKKDINENTKKSETQKKENIKEEKIVESKKTTPKKKQTSSSQISSIILTITKLLVVFFILIPLICINIGFISATVISIYYWIKGIDLFGLTLLFTGISSITIWLTHFIASILEEKRIKSYLLVIGIILTIIGGILFGLTLTKIEYIDEMPRQTELETMTNTYNTDKKVYIETHNEERVSKKIDETLEDNSFKIKVKYPVKLYNVTINQTDNYTFDEDSCEEYNLCGIYNYFDIKSDNEVMDNIKSAYNLFIDNLKDNKIYNYDKAYSPVIEVQANEKTMSLIEID